MKNLSNPMASTAQTLNINSNIIQQISAVDLKVDGYNISDSFFEKKDDDYYNTNNSKEITSSLQSLRNDAKKNLKFPGNELVLTGVKSDINRVLFWLSSKKGDYGRNNLYKGGLLYELLGVLCSNTNLSEWELYIKNEFNREFAHDLELLDVSLTTDTSYKKLIINLIVRDVLTGKVTTTTQGVER